MALPITIYLALKKETNGTRTPLVKGSFATVRDIARVSGLSLPTVGHILGNRGHRYRKETQEKVWRIALELGYRPNPAAASILTRRFNSVGLLLSVEPHRSNTVEVGLVCGLL